MELRDWESAASVTLTETVECPVGHPTLFYVSLSESRPETGQVPAPLPPLDVVSARIPAARPLLLRPRRPDGLPPGDGRESSDERYRDHRTGDHKQCAGQGDDR